LPTGVLPLTSVITTVRYGDHEHVIIRGTGSSPAREIPFDRLEEYVTEKGNPGNRKQVALAEVYLPSEILRLGFHFIDTPGVGSAISANTATTIRFLSEADAVIFVTSYESAMNEGELSFLYTVSQHVHRIFLVVNKLDLVSPEEGKTVLESIRKICTELGITRPQVFSVSARQGLQARLTVNQEMLTQSGLVELEGALTNFLASEKMPAAMLRYIERTIAMLATERLADCVNSMRGGLDAETYGLIKSKWERRLEQIETECLHVTEFLRERIRSELSSRFDCEIDSLCAAVYDDLSAQTSLLLTQPKKFLGAWELHKLADRARAVADERWRQWFSMHQDECEAALWAITAESEGQLESLYGEALEFGAELFRLPSFAAGWTISKDEARLSLKVVPRFEWCPPPAWELDIFPAAWIVRRVRRAFDRTLRAAITEYRDHVAQTIARAGSEWADRLGSDMQDALRSLYNQVTDAIEGRAPSNSARKVGALIDRLEKLQADLTCASPDRRPSPVLAADGRRPVINPCGVCERIVSEMFDFFAGYQYELSVNEHRRKTHLESGGFCPLHTWQYERITSAESICVAYAPLLTALARNLRGIASSSQSMDSIRESLGVLHSSHDSCPACQRLAEVEKEAVKEMKQAMLAGDGDYDDAGLCIRHLAILTARETDFESARRLIVETARVLDCIAEDMEAYTLKHNALRRDLLSSEEVSAYLFGLSLLVGDKRLFAV